MLPPGHIAGGFLAAKLASVWIPELSGVKYLCLASLFGFIPDLDFFYAFAKSHKLTIDEGINHRRFVTHAPLVYLVVFILWFWLFPTNRLIAITFILGTWSHFILDSVQGDGIPWLYPFRNKLYSLFRIYEFDYSEPKFFKHWWSFTKQYLKFPVATLEIAIIITAITFIFI